MNIQQEKPEKDFARLQILILIRRFPRTAASNCCNLPAEIPHHIRAEASTRA